MTSKPELDNGICRQQHDQHVWDQIYWGQFIKYKSPNGGQLFLDELFFLSVILPRLRALTGLPVWEL
jgi:hypothetical protein